MVARARRVQRGDDSVVKLRPVVPDDLSKKLRRLPDLGSRSTRCRRVRLLRIDEAAARKADRAKEDPGRRAPQLAVLEGTRAFFAKHAPEGLELDELSILGPIFVLKLRVSLKELGRRLVGEIWLYPDGSRIVELSTKCLPAEAFDVAVQLRAFLKQRGLAPADEQQTKTKKALGSSRRG